MTPYETRLLELLDQLEATLNDIRAHVGKRPEGDSAPARSIEAFADEAFRARDA